MNYQQLKDNIVRQDHEAQEAIPESNFEELYGDADLAIYFPNEAPLVRARTKSELSVTAVALAVALAVPMVCQAQVTPQAPPATTSTVATTNHHKTFIRMLKGGGIGCAIGGAVQLLRHGNPIKGCLVAGAAGAAIGGVRAYHEQLQQAHELAAANKAAGGSAVIATKTVEAKADDGQTRSTSALQSVTLPLNPEGVADHAASTADVLTKAATMTAQSQRPMSIEVQGTDSQRAWIVSQLRATNPDVKITEADATTPTLTLVAA